MNPARRAVWRQARNVLCIRLDNMGDVLMSTPAMHALKVDVPQRRITLMASRSGAQLLPFLPDIDEVIEYEAAWMKNGSCGSANDLQAVQDLKDGCFDAAVILTVYSQSALPAALMCHMAGIPLVLAHSRENPYRLLSDWVRDVEPQEGVRHEVQRQLDLVSTIVPVSHGTRLSFHTHEADLASLFAVLRRHDVADLKGAIVAHCGATAESRRYSTRNFAQALSLLGGSGRTFFLTGNIAERPLTEEVAAHCGAGSKLVNLAGQLSLGELGCLIQTAELLISNNTGPVHIAAAVQTPVVDLYALTNPQHTPWEVEHRLLYRDVPCKYCYRSICPKGHNACLEGVSPESVAQAALELLRATTCGGDLPKLAADV